MQKIVLWHCGYFAWLYFEPSVLCCWLGGRKGIRPVKKRVVWYWHGYLSGARCRLAYSPADATATHCLLLLQNPDWFTFLVPAHPRWPGKRAIKHVYICIFVGIVCKGLQFSHPFEVFVGTLLSVIWHFLLGNKSMCHAENLLLSYWCGYLSGEMCKWFACGPALQLMSLPCHRYWLSHAFFIKIQNNLPFQRTQIVLDKNPIY